MKYTFCIFLLCILPAIVVCSCFAQDWAANFRQQMESLEIEPGVLTEIQRFEKNGRNVSEEYASVLARKLRKAALSRTEMQLEEFQAGRCEEKVDVDFLKNGLEFKDFPIQLGPVEEEFEKGFMRVEVVACFPELTQSASEVLQLYTSPEFRLSTSSTLERIDEKLGSSCVQTKGIPVILEATFYCNQVQNFFTKGMAAQHSQVVSNPEADKYQNVFFKESVKSFVELSTGGLGFHYINYSRSDKIGGLKRKLGKSSVVKSQKKALEKLRQRLQEETD